MRSSVLTCDYCGYRAEEAQHVETSFGMVHVSRPRGGTRIFDACAGCLKKALPPPERIAALDEEAKRAQVDEEVKRALAAEFPAGPKP